MIKQALHNVKLYLHYLAYTVVIRVATGADHEPPGTDLRQPHPWVNKHVREYVESGGRKGHRWSGANTLLLTTRGRISGKLFRTALLYGEDEGRYVIVASRGGHPQHPNWYLNLRQEPQVGVQVGAEQFSVAAREAQGAERERLWALMVAIWPEYENYQAKTQRIIPVIILEPNA